MQHKLFNSLSRCNSKLGALEGLKTQAHSEQPKPRKRCCSIHTRFRCRPSSLYPSLSERELHFLMWARTAPGCSIASKLRNRRRNLVLVLQKCQELTCYVTKSEQTTHSHPLKTSLGNRFG